MTQLIQIISEGERRLFNNEFEEVPSEGGTSVPSILGVGDVQLDVPALEQRVALPGMHEGFSVSGLPDTTSDVENPTYHDAGKYNFEISGPDTRSVVEISQVFTDSEEMDYDQLVQGLAYLGVGCLVFLTDNKEMHLRFGPHLEHKSSVDMGYRSTENLRGYSSGNPLDHIKSFELAGQRFALINDISYTIITNPRLPDAVQGKRSPQSYALVNLGEDWKHVGYVREDNDVRRLIDGSTLPGEDLVEIPDGFLNVMPMEIDGRALLLQGGMSCVNVYEIKGLGTPAEKLEKVGELPVTASPIRTNLLTM